MHAKPGAEVRGGEPLFTLHTDEPERFDRALEVLEGGYDVGDGSAYTPSPLVIERVG
jgi:thymidine phosphorylase